MQDLFGDGAQSLGVVDSDVERDTEDFVSSNIHSVLTSALFNIAMMAADISAESVSMALECLSPVLDLLGTLSLAPSRFFKDRPAAFRESIVNRVAHGRPRAHAVTHPPSAHTPRRFHSGSSCSCGRSLAVATPPCSDAPWTAGSRCTDCAARCGRHLTWFTCCSRCRPMACSTAASSWARCVPRCWPTRRCEGVWSAY